MRYRVAHRSGSRRGQESDSFRRLVREEITSDDYVKTVERRVQERHEEAERGSKEGPPNDS
jgi:hypothetical protein